jgi:AcrR family transcriptional regulator
MLASSVSTIRETWSPKQLARRSLIVEAAVETLKREGIAGCTVRAIADGTPFTKGMIHYYFDDVREIVNAAYLQLTDDYVASVDAVAQQAGRPIAAFWRAVSSYVEGFRVHRRMGLLWLEYSSWAVRNGYERGVASSVEAIRGMFASRLAAIDTAHADVAVGLTRYLLGTVLELGASTAELPPLSADVARICGLRAPRADQFGLPHARVCPVCRLSGGSAGV